MKRIVLFTIFLVINNYIFCQIIVQKIDWKAGNQKSITSSVYIKKYINDESDMDSSLTIKSSLLVKDVTDSICIIQIKNRNPLLDAAELFYKGISKNNLLYKTIKTDFNVNKISLTFNMINKSEYESLLSKSYNEIIETVKQKAPDKYEEATESLNKLLLELKAKSYSSDILNVIIGSYRIQYSLTDTVYIPDTLANPFNLPNFTGASLKSYVERANNKTIDVVAEKEYDFEAYKKLLLSLSNKAIDTVSKIVDDTDNSSEVSGLMDSMFLNLFNSMEFDASAKMVVTKRLNNNWPVKIKSKTNLRIKSSKNDQKILINILLEIK